MESSPESTSLIGEAPTFLAMLEHVSRAAGLAKPVLVIGERGTGKELISARLHFLSPRWDQPLVKVNCAALPETILETELFGHVEGAFTGATRDKDEFMLLGRYVVDGAYKEQPFARYKRAAR
jgi:psp operon transcriptional activator